MCIQIHRSKYARFCIFYDVHLSLHTCIQLLTLCTKHSSMLICVVFVHHVEFVQSGASINRCNGYRQSASGRTLPVTHIASVRYNDMHLTLYAYIQLLNLYTYIQQWTLHTYIHLSTLSTYNQPLTLYTYNHLLTLSTYIQPC